MVQNYVGLRDLELRLFLLPFVGRLPLLLQSRLAWLHEEASFPGRPVWIQRIFLTYLSDLSNGSHFINLLA